MSAKAVIEAFLLPLPIGLLALIAGVLLRRYGHHRCGRALMVGACVLVFGASFGPIADQLLLPLESRYPAVLDASGLPVRPEYIAVLGSGYHPRAALPVTAALDATGVVRLAEGVRLQRQLPGVPLIVSGGSIRGNPPIAQGYAIAAEALGVSPASLILMDTPLDTAEEIRAIHARVGDAAVLLVTSAAHEPRAMALARREGLHAQAAPTGNLVAPWKASGIRLPSVSGAALLRTEAAIHEYLGLIALRFGIT